MKNNRFIVTAEYVRYQIKTIENAIEGTKRDLARLTREMEIQAHVSQIECYEKKLAEKKARLAAMI